MGLLDKFRSLWRDPVEMGGQSAGDAEAISARAAVSGKRPRAERRLRPEQMSHSSQRALSGYGSNPYDTYTWELHNGSDGERQLKRAADISRSVETGDPTNPYDTGTFKGGWK